MSIDPIIKYHDFRIVKGNTHINVLFDVVVPQKYKYKDEELVKKIIKLDGKALEKTEGYVSALLEE